MLHSIHSCKSKTLVFASLLTASPACLAFGEQVLQYKADEIGMGLIGLLSLVVLLLLIVLIDKLRIRAAKRKLQHLQDRYSEQMLLLDRFNVGTVHLNIAGEIIYTNKVAAYFFADKPDRLVGQSLLQFVPETQRQAVALALESKKYHAIQIFETDKKRHLRWGFNPQPGSDSQVAIILSIENVSELQESINHRQQQLDHLERLMQHAQLGQLTVNSKDNSVSCNQHFAEWLGTSPEQLTTDLKGLEKTVHSNDMFQWNQGLAQIKSNQSAEFSCRFVFKDASLNARVFGIPREANEQGQPIDAHFIIQNMNDLAEQRQLTQIANQRARGVLTANSHAMYLLDEKARLINSNNAFDMLFGLSAEQLRDKILGEIDSLPEGFRCLHPRPDNKGYINMPASSGIAREFELDLAEKGIKPVRFKLQAFKDAEGRFAGLVGSIEDISALKQAQQELEQERQKFNRFLDKAPLGIAMLDRDDRIIKSNNSLTKRLGLTDKELAKGSFYQLFNDPTNAAKAAKKLHQDGSLLGFHAKLKGHNEELHPSELNILMYDKSKHQYLCWISDISDEQYQQDRFEGLLQHSSMPMAVMGDSGFQQLNPAACQFFGIEDEDELFGIFPYSSELNGSAQEVAELEQKLTQIQHDGQAVSLIWQHRHNNIELPCQATFVPMYKGNELDSILCIWTDLRAIKEADSQRMEAINLHQAAERLVQEKQALLATSQDQLASQVKTLADTRTKLQAAEVDLSEKQTEISDLQQAHQDMLNNLNKLQKDYSQSRQSLAESEKNNIDLEQQLVQSSKRVNGLELQRNQIADALQYSEKRYKDAQRELQQSEELTRSLQQEQRQQKQKLAEFVQQITQLKQSISHKDKQLSDVSGQITALQSQLISSGQSSEKLRQQLINQRKASELAEKQRTELEHTCQQAQTELSSKARQIDHLTNEMEKFEELSQQQKGDLQAQQQKMADELAEKHRQLETTQRALNDIKRQSEQEKAEKQAQQQRLAELQDELADAERRSELQMQKIVEADQQWHKQQQALQEELRAKQQHLLQTEKILSEAKQQTEAERAEKAEQQRIFDQLQNELKEMEMRSAQQLAQMQDKDSQWQARQLELKQEVETKQQLLQETKQQLDKNQQQADAERLERLTQQQKLEQLKIELADVENRAAKQEQMMHGSDEQWRQHHAEIEQQKIQLQQALAEAQQQNSQIQQQLEGRLQELKKAEGQVTETQSGEQKLQQELDAARQQTEALQLRIKQQEEQETQLQRQLTEQQKALIENERSIRSLKDEQQHLTQELQTVQQEYSDTQKNIELQNSDQSELATQLAELEKELNNSKRQLDSKESALQDAQKQLESTQSILAKQEQDLVAAHQLELKQAQLEAAAQLETLPKNEKPSKTVPEFASQAMPANPDMWFELLPYLQRNPSSGPLQVALNALMDQLAAAVDHLDKAVSQDNTKDMILGSRRLAKLAYQINSAPLNDIAQRLETDSQNGQVDNISIFWPNVKTSLTTTLRVIYSHLHG